MKLERQRPIMRMNEESVAARGSGSGATAGEA